MYNLNDGTFLKTFLKLKTIFCLIPPLTEIRFSLCYVVIVMSHFLSLLGLYVRYFLQLTFPLSLHTFVKLRRTTDSYHLHLPGAVLDPFQVDVTEAGPGHPLQAVHIVLVDLHAEDLRVALDVVPLGVGLQRLLDGGILQPGGQFGWVHQEVDDALEGGGGEWSWLVPVLLLVSAGGCGNVFVTQNREFGSLAEMIYNWFIIQMLCEEKSNSSAHSHRGWISRWPAAIHNND